MPIAVIRSEGRITLPKTIRDSITLKPGDRVVLLMEGDHAVLYPLRGTILDAAASLKIPPGKKPLDFSAIRRDVQRRIAKRAAARGR